MEFKYEKNRVYLDNENGKMVAEVTFPSRDNQTVVLNHTFVDDSLRGQGIASKLMEEAYAKIKEDNKKVVLTCSYAVKWFEKNKQYRDIVAE